MMSSMVDARKLYTSDLAIYSPRVGQPRTDYRQAEKLYREMFEEKKENNEVEEVDDVELVDEDEDDDYLSSFPPVQYSYTFCEVSFLFHKLNQLAKRRRQEINKKKEAYKSPDESMESFCIDFARLSQLNLLSAKFMEALKDSLEVQAKAVRKKFLVKTFVELLWDALEYKNEGLKRLRKEAVSEFNQMCDKEVQEFFEFWERNRVKWPHLPVRTVREF